MFLNQSKINEQFKPWRNLSTLAKTRNFLSLENMTSAMKFEFLYDQNILFENCTVFDMYDTNISQQEIDDYEKMSEEFKTEIVDKSQFPNVNLSESSFNPPYVQTKKCKEVGDLYLRTEYKDLSGWSDHLWYLTLFHRPANAIKENRFKYTKMGNELLLSLRWELVIEDEIDFGFKIHFHSPDQAPNSKQAATLGINGKAFKWVTLGYSHSMGSFLKKPYKTNCYDYREFNFKSRQDCIDTCKIELSKSHCNTLPLYTLMEVERTANFINKKEHAECFYRFNIGLYCEERCFRKDCSSDFYTASILSEVSQSKKTFVIDIVKPNTGINQEFNYKQSMKLLGLVLYLGSTLSLWYGISVYGCRTYLNYAKKYFQSKKNAGHTASRINFLRRARRMLSKSFGRSKSSRTSSNKTANSVLSYQTLHMIERLQKESTRVKEKLGYNFDSNMDYNYRNNLTYYDNQMMNGSIKFIILDKNQNVIRKK